jgi:hypothetical protein
MARDTSWMSRRWGIFVHYLADAASNTTAVDLPAEAWYRRVDGFDVERFADRAAAAGASWVGFTLGQNSGFFCSPNPVYDGFVGRTPSRLSRRDLLGDLAAALARRGLRTMAYLPSHAPALDLQAVHALRCTPPWDCSAWSLGPAVLEPAARAACDDRVSEFQRRWEAVVAHWSQRWGGLVSAWWFDGCYHAERMYRHADAPNFASFAAAARAGNPQALVAMNPGVVLPVRPQAGSDEDYTAGELSDHLPVPQQGRWPGTPDGATIDGRQVHYFTYMGPWWGAGQAPRLPDGMAAGWTALATASGAGVTWDIPVAHDGAIPEAILWQLDAIRDAASRP